MELITKEQYQKAGFTDEEINSFELKKIEDNTNVETTSLTPIDTKPMQEYWQGVMGTLNKYSDKRKQTKENLQNLPNQIYGEKSEFIDHIQIGIGASNFGLGAALLNGEDLPTAYQREYGEDESFLEGLVQRGTTMAFDLPFYLYGAAAGAYLAPPKLKMAAAPFGAGFLNGSIRKTLIEAIKKKEVNEPVDYMKIFLEEGVKEGAKEGAQLAVGLNASRLLGTKLATNYFAKVLSRFTAFESVGAAMHGQLPGGRELAYSGIFWGLSGFDGNVSKIAKAEKHYKKKADELYVQTNKKPIEILVEENLDRTIKNTNDSINNVIPKSLENLVTKTKDQIEISTSEIIKSEDPAMQHMFDNMAFGSSKNKIPFIDKAKEAGHIFEKTQVDFRAPLKRAMKEANMRVKPSMAELNVYEQAAQLSRSYTLGDFFLLRKTLDGKGKVNGESLKEIFQNMSEKNLQE